MFQFPFVLHKAIMRSWSSILVLTFCASVAFGTSLREKRFSLFSVVQFPNDMCQVASNTAFYGTCLSVDECNDEGGTSDGNCASGFGVCCMFVKNTCDDIIEKNCTYVQNAAFPTAQALTAATKCEFKVKSDIDICQIRLDFQTFQIANPAATGACTTDTFIVKGTSGKNPPTVCGTLTGQHMYIETARSTSDKTLTFQMDGTMVATRQWNVKVQMIECISKWKADHDCVQWFTGASGKEVKSYNFVAAGMLQSQNFATCVRREEGYCAIDWTQSTVTAVDPFQLNTLAAADADILVATCTVAYIGIPSTVPDAGAMRGAGRFCGGVLSTYDTGTVGAVVRSTAPSFVFRTWSGAADQVLTSGYNLDYKQVPCGN